MRRRPPRSTLLVNRRQRQMCIRDSKERVQVYEGTVIKMQGTGLRRTFTVRRLAYGVGVERTFLINSPRVTNVRLVREGKVRRSKLFYLRHREGKAAKVKEKQKF